MKRTLFILLITLTIFSIVFGKEDDDEEGGGKKKIMCKGSEVKFDKTIMTECGKEMKERHKKNKKDDDDSGEKKSKKTMMHDNCFTACKLEKMKVVKDNKFDLDALYTSMEKIFPKDAQQDLKDGAKKCAEKVKDKELVHEDNCKSFEGIGACLFKNIKDVCWGDKKGKKGKKEKKEEDDE